MRTYSSKTISTLLGVCPATARTIMGEIGTIGISKHYRVTEVSLYAWLSRKLGHEFASNDFRLYGPEEVSKILNICPVTARKVIQKCGGFTMNRRVRVPKIYFDYWLSERGSSFAENIVKYDNSKRHS